MTTAAWTCRTTAGADWGTQTADTHTNMLACHAAQYACGVLDACADWLGGWVSDLELLKTLIVFEVFRGSVLSNIIYIQKPNSLDWKLAPTLVLRHYFADAFTWCVCVCVSFAGVPIPFGRPPRTSVRASERLRRAALAKKRSRQQTKPNSSGL